MKQQVSQQKRPERSNAAPRAARKPRFGYAAVRPRLALHQTIGNHGVLQRHLPTAQARFNIGSTNDKYEQEADRLATEVMRRSQATNQQKPALSRAAPARSAGLSALQTTCAGEEIQSARPNNIGKALPERVREFFEPRFGRDFSRVRIHTDAGAAASARAFNAQAMTVGHSIVFAQGRFAPATDAGQRLLAHELAHVVQQQDTARIHAPVIQRQAEAAVPWWLEKKPTPINTIDDFKRFMQDPYVRSSYPFVRFLDYGGEYPGPQNAQHNTIYFDKDLQGEGGKDREYRGMTHAREGEGKIFVRIGRQKSYEAAAATIYHELRHVGHHRSILDIGKSQRLIAGLKGGVSAEEKTRFEAEKAASLTKTYGADVQSNANSEILARARTFVEFFDHHPAAATAQLEGLVHKYYDFASEAAKKMAKAEIVGAIKKSIAHPKVKKLITDLHKVDMLARPRTEFFKELCEEPAIARICPQRRTLRLIRTRSR